MGLTGRVKDAPPPEFLQDRGRGITWMVLEVEEYFVTGLLSGGLLPSPLLVSSGHKVGRILDAPFQQGEGGIILVSPREEVGVEFDEP